MTKRVASKTPHLALPSPGEPQKSKVDLTAERSLASLKRPREEEILDTPRKKSKIERKEERIAQVMALFKEANALAWKHRGPHQELDLAIQKYHDVFYMRSDEKHKMMILLNWGLALLKRNNRAKEIPPEEISLENTLYGAFSDADQAIARFHEGLVRIHNDENLNARLRLGLGHAYLKKYELSREQADLDFALQHYDGGLNFSIPQEEIRAGLLKAKGIVLTLLKRSAEAQECYRKALALNFENETLRENIESALKGLSPSDQ